MNHTANYHLPQWELSDRVLMEDFNQMCRDLEDGLTKISQNAANDSSSAGQTASLAAAAAEKAQSTADEALAKANAAYSPSKQPFLIGTYVGNGYEIDKARFFSIGFTPSAILIFDTSTGQCFAGNSKSKNPYCITNGFAVIHNQSTAILGLNSSGSTYVYIAFR